MVGAGGSYGSIDLLKESCYLLTWLINALQNQQFVFSQVLRYSKNVFVNPNVPLNLISPISSLHTNS